MITVDSMGKTQGATYISNNVALDGKRRIAGLGEAKNVEKGETEGSVSIDITIS